MLVLLLELGVGPDRFEYDVEVARHAEPRPQRRGVELMRAEVMKDGGTVIEHRLDVDELPGPVPFPEDPLAERKAVGPHGFGVPGASQVFRAGRPDYPLPIGGWDRGGPIEREEDLTQLDPPIRLDHDGLTAPQRTVALRRRPEPRHVPHHAISDQIRMFPHGRSPPPWIVAEARDSSHGIRSRSLRVSSETNRRAGTRPLSASTRRACR